MILDSTRQVNKTKCSLCRRPAAASRHGAATITICADCAIHELPGLIADATIDQCGDWRAAKRIAADIECRYWRAMTYRLMRERGRA